MTELDPGAMGAITLLLAAVLAKAEVGVAEGKPVSGVASVTREDGDA